jgi:hypothetical protein
MNNQDNNLNNVNNTQTSGVPPVNNDIPVQPQAPVQQQAPVGQPVQPQPNVYPNGNYQQNVQPIYNGGQQVPPKKKSNVGLIVGIVVAVVVLIMLFFITRACKAVTNIFNEADSNINEIKEKQEKLKDTLDSNLNNSNTTSNTVDSNVNKTMDETGAFLMPIEDVFSVSGRGTIVTGRIERGTVKIGDDVQIIGLNNEKINTQITGIEMFRKALDTAKAGDNVGLLLKGVARDEVKRGQLVIKPNSMGTYTKFEADITMLTKEQGGRHTPFFNNFRPQFYFFTTDITGIITLPDDVDMVNPGDMAKISVELISPVGMEVGTKFNIREGGRTIATGTVTKLN